MNPDTMLTDGDAADDGRLSPALAAPSYGSSGGGPYRRRPIVVRDPKTGETRIIQAGAPSRTIPAPGPAGAAFPSPAPRPPFRGPFDDANDYDDAPVVKIVSGYRGRQIVVRDPSRRAHPEHPQQHLPAPPLGVRDAGVRKNTYYDRRGNREPSYSPDRYDDRRATRPGGAAYYDDDDDDDARMFGRGRDDYDRAVDHAMVPPHEYPDSRYDRDYYRGGGSGHNGPVPPHDDLTGKVVYVDNLSDDVTTRGLADLFSMVGTVKELRLLYDRQGNPNGSADIVFQHRADAEEAIKSLHNVPLNNRPMRLSMGNGL